MARLATQFNQASTSAVTLKSDLQIWRRGGLGQREVYRGPSFVSWQP
jgi:hypothetical protein